jgi:peptide/nickel transport system permease protein
MRILKKWKMWDFNRFKSFLTTEDLLYISKRILQGLLTLFAASFLCFLIIKFTPGDYLDTLKQNPKISPQRIEELKKQFGLNQPFFVQYFSWLWQIIRYQNFGISFVYFRPVSELLATRIPATLELSFAAIIFSWAIAIPLGIMAAVKQNKFTDKILQVISYSLQGFPTLITALLFLIIAQNLSPLFPIGGRTSLNHNELSAIGKFLDIVWHATLPTIAVSIIGFAGLQRLMRGQLLDVLRLDYIQTARAKGLPENKVIYVHALRNAINPLVTLLGFEFASLLSGSFIAENVFNWPGLGRLILQAVTAKDIYLVMASLMMGAIMLILGNLLADILLKFVDPRIKLENLK